VSFEAVQTACVIRYPYLWAREAAAGETEGRKSRPAAVGVRVDRPEGPALILFPITSQQPEKGRFAVELPEIEKRRAGLDASMRLWLVLDEYNFDIGGRSYYLEPAPPLGRFSRAFFAPLMHAFAARRREARAVNRGP
jgi:hypothetical protein